MSRGTTSHYHGSSQPSSSSRPMSYGQTPITTSHHMMDPLEPVNVLDMIPDPDEDMGDEENIFRDMSFDEILEDLNARFLVNLPKEEMNLVRVYWQAEQAHWFYEDYLRPLNPLLPQLSQRSFTHLIIASSPLYSELSADDYDAVWEEYCRYKRMVPCCGGILINAEGDKVLMVRGWKSNAGWCFPRGKINSEESEVACAIREVLEETGFDMAGRVNPKDRIQTQISAQTVTMFMAKDIDENTVFKTQTKKEIGAIEWVPFVDLPTWTGKKGPKTTTEKGKKKFYNVTPFVGPLKRWMSANGINPNPKRRPTRSGQNSQQDTSLRALQPYNFDQSPGPSPQPYHAQPKQSDDNTALDNLFHRFVHKQEQELDSPDIGGKDNKAGLQRLFQNLDVLKHEGHAASVNQQEQEKNEDDALARLLSGLGTSTPAPRAAELNPAPTEKAGKLLAMLNTPVLPAKQQTPAKPHQASLLAMLASPQQQSRSDSSTSRSSTETVTNSNKAQPAIQGPPLSAQQERARKQQALLEGITGGFGAVSPSHPVGLVNAGYKAYDQLRSVDSKQNSRQAADHYHPPSHASPPFSQQRLEHLFDGRVAREPTAPSRQGALPPYEQVASNGFHTARPPPAQHVPHTYQQQSPQTYNLPPVSMPEVSSGQRNLLNVLQTQPMIKQTGPVMGYRPVTHQYSAQTTPAHPNPPFNNIPVPPSMMNTGSQGHPGPHGPPSFGLSQHPLPGRPIPQGYLGGPVYGHGIQGVPGIPGQKGPPNTLIHQHSHQPPLPLGFMNDRQGPAMPNGILQGPVQGQNRPSSFHHPVPRPPNAQAGTLLGMLNDGSR